MTLILALMAFSDPVLANPITAQENYIVHCQGCHGADGKGLPSVVPGFSAELAQILLTPGGREYLIRVPGVAMAPISDADLAGVLNWVVKRYLEPDLSTRINEFNAQEVGASRNPPLDQPERIRRRLIAQGGGS